MKSAYPYKNLQIPSRSISIETTTKTPAARCAAVNSAFFVPKFHQAWRLFGNKGIKNRTRNSQNAVGLIGLNTRPFHGNKPCRLVSVVETRPPANIADGQTLTKTPGGQAMPNISKMGKHTPADFSFTINLPANSFIKRFVAINSSKEWLLTIETESGQNAFIQNSDHTRKHFNTLDSLAYWLASQGVVEMSVFLPFQTEGGLAQ